MMDEHRNKQNKDKEENKVWFAILLLQLLQPYAATSEGPLGGKGFVHNKTSACLALVPCSKCILFDVSFYRSYKRVCFKKPTQDL